MSYKENFINLMIEAGVLKFGEFKTKSGRLSPYFVNTGNYSTGKHIALLGEYYADVIMDKLNGEFDFLYGPAYKGITLACATSIALYRKYNKEVPFAFNRKEAKDHGEGGIIVSYQPKDNDRAVIIEDVITAGTSVRESVPILKNAANNIEIKHMIISCDRKEIGYNNMTAIEEVKKEFDITTHAIVNVYDIIDILHNKQINGTVLLDDSMKEKIEAYVNKYCAKN